MDKFLVCWCNEGLECIINMSEQERNQIVSILKGEEIKDHSNPIHYLILRAKFNTQRHYEIYLVETDINEESLRQLFETDPQFIVDTIRKKGSAIYSDRRTKKPLIV